MVLLRRVTKLFARFICQVIGNSAVALRGTVRYHGNTGRGTLCVLAKPTILALTVGAVYVRRLCRTKRLTRLVVCVTSDVETLAGLTTNPTKSAAFARAKVAVGSEVILVAPRLADFNLCAAAPIPLLLGSFTQNSSHANRNAWLGRMRP